MPELPEVETVRKVLEGWVKSKTISKIVVPYPSIIANADVASFNASLDNQVIKDIDRFGKFIIFKIGNKIVLSHLRMEGKYFLAHYPNSSFEEGIEYNPNLKPDKFSKHVHLIFEMSDGSLLLYHDVRKFGRFYLLDKDDYLTNPLSPLSKLGHEPFELKNGDYLYQKTRKFKKSVKETLLDQSILVGLGNIYVDEVCFEARIAPTKLAKDLTLKECALLTSKSKEVLNKAIELGGSTIRSYHFANDASGRFQNELNVYGKEGMPCPVCGTPIVKTRLGGRGTHFCPHCQHVKLDKKIKVIGVTGLIGSGKSTVCSIFAKHGYQVIDADKIAKEALDVGNYCYYEVIKHFGKEILNPDKTINRPYLRGLVVKDPKEVQYLNDLIHPYVKKRTIEMMKDDGDYLLDVPLLFESEMDKLCDLTIFVNVKEAVRKERLLKRNTMSLKEASKLNGNSKEAASKIMKAMIVVDNSLEKAKMEYQVKELIKDIIQINRGNV